MSKIDAMRWLINHLDEWPRTTTDNAPDGWMWYTGKIFGKVLLICINTGEIIGKNEWSSYDGHKPSGKSFKRLMEMLR